jgi:hypothetical protein
MFTYVNSMSIPFSPNAPHQTQSNSTKVSYLTFFLKGPFQQGNKLVIDLGITQITTNKHRTKAHKALATSQCRKR